MSRNLRTVLIFGSFISLIGAAFYPIYFRPLMRLEEYQKEQAINRAGVVQEDVQPPGELRNQNSRVCAVGWGARACPAVAQIFGVRRLAADCAVHGTEVAIL
uniref:Small integral membrane protein 20 n=1 Tax=Ursus americanus TaxID=9643 RepID=A0A452QZ80_URSAM